MLQNARLVTFRVFELLRENQQGRMGGGGDNFTQIKVLRLKTLLWILC